MPVKNPLLFDVVSILYPVREYAFSLIKTGQLPLWNPLMFGGYPLAANFQSAVFFPPNLIYFLVDFPIGWTFQIILQPFIAFVFTYLLLRNFELSKVASLFGGVIFAFSGFNMIWLEYNVMGQAASLIPLILLLTDKYIKNEKVLIGIFLSIVIAIQVFAGYPQMVLYTLMFLGFYGIIKKISLSKALKLISYIFIGLGLSAVQLLPGIELVLNSQRTAEVLEDSLRFLPPIQLISLLAPDFFGNPATGNFWGVGNYSNFVGFSGASTLVLAVGGALSFKKNNLVKFFSFFSIGILLLVITNPISLIFHSLPIPGFAGSSATRLLVFLNLSLAILASFGIENLTFKKKNIIFLFLPLIILLGVFCYVYFSLQQNLDQKILTNFGVAQRNLILPIIISSTTALIFMIIHKFKKIVVSVLFILVVFELFRFGWKYNSFSEKEFLYPKTSVFEFLNSQQKPFRVVGSDVVPVNTLVPYELETFSGYDTIYPKTTSKIISTINTNDVYANLLGKYANIENFDSKIFDLTNSKFIFSLKTNKDGKIDGTGSISYKFEKPKFKKVFEDKSIAILENVEALPRYFFVTDWEVEKNNIETLKKINDRSFPLNKKIILNEDFDVFKKVDDKGENIIDLINYTPNEISWNISNQNSGFLFVGDTYYPGWKAYSGKDEIEIYRANLGFRAIPITPGNHAVFLRYEPKTFFWGILISLSSLTAIFVILILKLKYKNA